MTAPKKKSLKEILGGRDILDNTYSSSDSGNMLYDQKSLIGRMKRAYQKRKREKKIDALKNSETLWKGLE